MIESQSQVNAIYIMKANMYIGIYLLSIIKKCLKHA